MHKILLMLLPAWFCAAAGATGLKPLDDEALGQVTARDGVSFAAHIVINDPELPGAVADSRLWLGFGGDGPYRYVVIRNLRGVVDIGGVHIGIEKKPDGGEYVAVSMPSYVKFSSLGFESLSVQSDPLAPVTSSMGSVNVNGTMNMQGQLRVWAH